MTTHESIQPFGEHHPQLDPAAWVAANATVIGAATIGPDSGIFFGAIVRADVATVSIGSGTNVQDNAVVHTDPAFPTRIGSDVTIGHGAIVHGCTVEDNCLIGMHATVLNGAVVGAGSLVAAGAVVREGAVIPPDSLVAGVPAQVRRPLTDAERERVQHNASSYRLLTQAYRDSGR
jgi:carbonic anhydrase/acetyltransferase-like protein (isoleucine patch superfamily)